MERTARAGTAQRPAEHAVKRALAVIVYAVRVWISALILQGAVVLMPKTRRTKPALFLISEACKNLLAAHGEED